MDTFDRIEKLLKERNISGAKMSKDLKFSSGLYSQWKKRSQSPSRQKIIEMALYFDVDPNYLLGLTGEEEEPPRKPYVGEVRIDTRPDGAGFIMETRDKSRRIKELKTLLDNETDEAKKAEYSYEITQLLDGGNLEKAIREVAEAAEKAAIISLKGFKEISKDFSGLSETAQKIALISFGNLVNALKEQEKDDDPDGDEP